MTNLSPHKMRAQLRDLGIQVRLGPEEYVTKVKVDGDTVTVLHTVVKMRDLVRESCVTHRGVRMLRYTRDTAWRWRLDTSFDNIEPVEETHRKMGRVYTDQSHAEQLEWERDCARPGTAHSPIDTYDRTFQATYDSTVETTDHMLRHWSHK